VDYSHESDVLLQEAFEVFVVSRTLFLALSLELCRARVEPGNRLSN